MLGINGNIGDYAHGQEFQDIVKMISVAFLVFCKM
jgi:hypothetical protein